MLAFGLRILRFTAYVMTFGIISGSPLYAADEAPPLGVLDALLDGQTLTYADYGQRRISTFRIVKRPDGITFPDFQMWFSKGGITVSESNRSSKKKVPARIADIDKNCISLEYTLYKKNYKRQRYCLFGNKLWSSNFYVGNPIVTSYYYINPNTEQSDFLRKEGARLASLSDPNSPESVKLRAMNRQLAEEDLERVHRQMKACTGGQYCESLEGQESVLLAELGRPNGYAAAQEAESAATLAAGLNIIVAGAQANADRMTQLRQRSIEERQTQLRAASRANTPAYPSAEPAVRAGGGAFGALPAGAGNDPQRTFWASRCQGKPNDGSPTAQGCQQSWRQIMSNRNATTRSPNIQNRGMVTSAQSSPIGVEARSTKLSLAANSCLVPSQRGRSYYTNQCNFPITVSYCVLNENNAFTCLSSPLPGSPYVGRGSIAFRAGEEKALATGAGQLDNYSGGFRLRSFACRNVPGTSAFLTQADPPKGICR